MNDSAINFQKLKVGEFLSQGLTKKRCNFEKILHTLFRWRLTEKKVNVTVDDFSELLVGEFLSQGVTKKRCNFEKILHTLFRWRRLEISMATYRKNGKCDGG